MQKLINLALRRNLFFSTAEIYPNTNSGFYDYGPVGLKIKNNIVEFWRKHFVEEENALEIDGSIILPEPVFKASGHLEGFFDPVVKCKKCGLFYRADKLLEAIGVEIGEKTPLEEIDALIHKHNLKCEKCKSDFEKPFRFNLMYEVNVGVGKNNKAYLRPEACQNIFLDFARIYKGARRNLPLPIAQVGKAFRNEIAPRNALIRLREITQMDVEVFFDPDDIDNYDLEKYKELELPVKLLTTKEEKEFVKLKKLIDEKIVKFGIEAYYLAKVYKFFLAMGFNKDRLRFKEVSKEDRPFYSLATWDLEAKVEDFGWIEIVANNYRTDHDLKNHQKVSKSNLEVISNEKKVLPHVFEISMGTDRIFYCLLAQNLTEINGKFVLKLNSEIQPFDFAIFPLVKKDGLSEKAKEIFNILNCGAYKIIYDEKGSIGKRYARIDELGVRYAITIDYDTLKDDTVTLRDSWTTEQKRVKIKDLNNLLFELKYNKN